MLVPSGQQYALLEWLKHVTFPMESKFADLDFARKVYEMVVPRYINSGVSLQLPLGVLRAGADIAIRPRRAATMAHYT
jgi:guanine deaminase